MERYKLTEDASLKLVSREGSVFCKVCVFVVELSVLLHFTTEVLWYELLQEVKLCVCAS